MIAPLGTVMDTQRSLNRKVRPYYTVKDIVSCAFFKINSLSPLPMVVDTQGQTYRKTDGF